MTDQVTYWISQKLQGADIQLDAGNGQSVSVSVQIKGNEAQVAFRSDQAEVRQILNQSLPELEKMLGNEGLMLSGATVGGQADGFAQQHQSRSESTPSARAVSSVRGGPEAGSVTDLPKAATPAQLARSGRSLDLYV